MARTSSQKKRGKYLTGDRLYSVKNCESMTVEELIDSIRDKIQLILVEKADLSKTPDNPEIRQYNQGNNNQNYG